MGRGWRAREYGDLSKTVPMPGPRRRRRAAASTTRTATTIGIISIVRIVTRERPYRVAKLHLGLKGSLPLDSLSGQPLHLRPIGQRAEPRILLSALPARGPGQPGEALSMTCFNHFE